MMDAVDTAYLEAAVLWLAQTILETLFTGKLEVWIRQIGLADDIEKLRSEMERVEMLVSAVKGRVIGNRPLARSLARLKELLYDADDVIDELDYYRLQQQVQGVTSQDPDGTDGHRAGQVERSSGNADMLSASRSGGQKRSKAWADFAEIKDSKGKTVEAECKYCHTVVKYEAKNGTSVLHNHINSASCTNKRPASDRQQNPSSICDGTTNCTPVAIGNLFSGKRMRTDKESTCITATNTHPWNKTEFSNRIQEITRQLQDIQRDVSEVLKLYGSDFIASSNHYWSTRSDVCPETSSLNQPKIYGRVAEKTSSINMITADICDGITVLPIVGIGGVGKTTLAQLVYDDSKVKSQFQRIWVWVSVNFDEVRLTREMLDFVSLDRQEGSQKIGRYEGINSFAKFHELLKGHMEFQSKRFLLVLDDVWDNMDDYQWNELLASLKLSHAKGNVIVVTTRKLSVAQRIGTVEPIKLGALADEDFWPLFKACAFGDENYDGHVSLSTIGRQIADKLKGNPLAAETAGALLRKHLTIDHWNDILKNEDWKSLQLSRGIMPALKHSYDQLPYHLQQCFLYCCIFPNGYQFLSKDLVCLWIAQGFVYGGHSSKRLEEIGQDYLFDLVNSGFFQQTETKVSSLGNQTCYVMCGLMHDFAMVVSRTECAAIDGLQCNEILPTVRHLSIVTDSAYTKDHHGNILRNEKFEKKLRDVVTSVRKLRTLVLIGQYDPFFLQLFQDSFKEAQNLRVLQISTKCAGFNSFLCNVANPSHLRYLKLEAGEEDGAFPQVFSKFYHLHVLCVGSDTELTISNGVNNLVSLRHLVAEEDVYSSIANIGKMTSLQELHNFSVQNSSGFEITQLQSMNELVELGVSQLQNVRARADAYGARLRDKQHLEKLDFWWTMSQHVYDSYMSSEPSIDRAREVLEGLEPHQNLKHLQISGYDGATAPKWLTSSLTSLQTLHLEYCENLQIIPSLERLPFLRKFELRNMLNVTEVSIPSLEELVLDELPKLERCSCTSLMDLNSSLRVLRVTGCPVLKAFPLFENCQEFKIEQKPWLSSLEELIIHKCPQLLVPHRLPPSTSISNLSVSTLPSMEGSSSGTLTIGSSEYTSDEMRTLDGKMLSFHNLRFLTHLRIKYCRSLTYISFEGLQVHGSPSLKSLRLYSCTALEKVEISCCEWLDSLEGLQSLRNLKALKVYWSRSLKSLQLHSCTALEELTIDRCGSLAALEGLQSLGGLRRLVVYECPGLSLSRQGYELCPRLERLEMDKPSALTTSFCKHFTSLLSLRLRFPTSSSDVMSCLTDEQEKALQLLTSLQELKFVGFMDLPAGLHSLPSLKRLKIIDYAGISRLPEKGLPPSLEQLEIKGASKELKEDCRILATSKLNVKIDGKYVN